MGSSRAISLPRPTSPSTSVVSEKPKSISRKIRKEKKTDGRRKGRKMIDPSSSEEGRDEKNGPSHGGHHPASHYHSSTHSHHNQTEVPPYHYTQLFDSGRGNLKVPNNSAALQRSLSPSIAVSAETISHSMGSSRAISLPRPTSPSPSVVSEKTEVDLQENQEREEE
ncbi:hypothetical protein WA026_008214 [Henosepilachna vigintioctopunctata]|uniref:Uncharacterized protein n=1 Tax=Henosepilachna vigintioctopunctata TaxID=420089 RepID=A0AAW1TKZ6_9CUCU